MKPGVAERKWEIDSLCHPVRLAHGFWRTTGDTTPFREEFWKAMRTDSGLRMIWPMSQLMRALTSRDDAEVVACLRSIKATHSGTGFIHGSFDQDDPTRYTRSWFAWANSLFGELVLCLAQRKPALLRSI
jgi:meiotically up-regulated gene 157 (Mug157) protein